MRFATALVTADFPTDEQWDAEGNLVQPVARPLADHLCELFKNDLKNLGPPSMWAAAGWEFGGYFNRWHVWFHVGDTGETAAGVPILAISVTVHIGWFASKRRKMQALSEVCVFLDQRLRNDPAIQLRKWQLTETGWSGKPQVRDWDLSVSP